MKKLNITHPDNLDYSGDEALNTICSNIAFSGRDLKRIVFTSCTAGDGKSFITMNVAGSLAKRDKRVVLVDADLRRSHMVSNYGICTEGEPIRGLAHYLVGKAELEDVVYETNIPNFFLIPHGRDMNNPVPLLGSGYFAKIIDALAKHFDMVLIDTPPVGLVIDAAEIAECCDGVVFVVEYNKTKRSDFLQAKLQMEKTNCPILGCVINKMTFNNLSAQKYYNKYQYSHYNNEYYTSEKVGGQRRKRKGK